MIIQTELDRIKEQAAAQYPLVCCGVLMIRPGHPDDRLMIPCRNMADELHDEDPERCPRTRHDGYSVSPADLLTIGRREAQGYRVSVIYYSRIDKDASFSEISRRSAVIDGRVVYPEAVYLPVAVVSGRVTELQAFRWDPTLQDFRGTALP